MSHYDSLGSHQPQYDIGVQSASSSSVVLARAAVYVWNRCTNAALTVANLPDRPSFQRRRRKAAPSGCHSRARASRYGVRTIRFPSFMCPGDDSSHSGGRVGADGRAWRNEVGAGERQTSSDRTTSETSRPTATWVARCSYLLGCYLKEDLVANSFVKK